MPIDMQPLHHDLENEHIIHEKFEIGALSQSMTPWGIGSTLEKPR